MSEFNNLDKFLFYTNQILEKFEGKNSYTISTNYLIENCFRTYDILVTIDTINKSSLKLQELEHPVGILLRSGLYDFIYSQYIMNTSLVKNQLNIEKLEIEVRKYMNGHFNNINPDLELNDQVKHLDKFKDFGSKKEFKQLGILKQGKSFAIEKKLNYLECAINNWEWYSKYEHYGVFTNHMYNKKDDNRLRMKESIQLLYCNIYFSLISICELNSDLLALNDIEILGEISINKN
ncbi:MAG: hypothetical protein HYU68_07040 [Bacteroidetes bacterium]|nr:hypothetical protein [Bacteroidota bacterium]